MPNALAKSNHEAYKHPKMRFLLLYHRATADKKPATKKVAGFLSRM
ncbi:hypothetical protein RU94_GL001986 [Enterococcus asini]|nr:hypothetical protein RU94_GL001986 [Enterococcus asini]